jgi:ketosteroid isomerase-like protein
VGDDEQAVQAANRAFYEAFEARDLDAMSYVWEHSGRATCTHPGWGTIRGWPRVTASFFAIFQNGHPLQFILTNEHVQVSGDAAWVAVDENIIDDQAGSTVAALNVFSRDELGERWRMVVHHASPVGPGSPELPD